MVRKSEKILKVDLGIFNVIKVNKKKRFCPGYADTTTFDLFICFIKIPESKS